MIETAEAIEEIDISNKRAWGMVRSEPAKTVELAKENLQRATELDYLKGIAWAKGNIGAACTWLGEYENAIENCYAAIDLLHECDDLAQELQIEYYLYIVFSLLGDHAKQMEHVNKSLQKAEEINHIQGQANALNGIGTYHYTYGNFEEAVEFLNRAKKLAEEAGDDALLGRVYNGLSNAHIGLEKYEEALTIMEQALGYVEKSGEQQPLSYCHEGIAEIYSKLGNYPKALEHYGISNKVREKMGFKGAIGKGKILEAETYRLAGDNLSAVQSYKDALIIGQELQDYEVQYKSHLGLSELYEDMGNHALFVKHFKAYHTAQSDFKTQTEDKKVKAYELKGRMEQIQKEKEALEKKNVELESYFKDVQTLSSIGHEITSTLDLEAIFQIIYERINSLMDASGIFIGTCNFEKNVLEVPLAIDGGVRDKYFEYSIDDPRKISNWVIKNESPVHINEYSREIFNYIPEGEKIQHNAPESLVVLPLIIKEKIVGILYAQSFNVGAFSKHHFNILQSFASYLSIAIDNAKLYKDMDLKVQERTKELQKTYKNSELLNKIGQELISTLEFEDVFEKLYKNVNKLMDATIFGVRLYDPENNKILYPYEYERGLRLKPLEASMDNKNNYSVVCIETQEAIHINDNPNEFKKWVDEIVVIDGDLPNSLIFYPLVNNDDVFGVISVQSFEKNAYTPYHLIIVKTLAQYTVLAFQNARRYEEMEEVVKERTSEITKTYENIKLLSEIGKNITSQLSVEAIIKTAYDTINEVMEAEGFGIGVYIEEENAIDFPGYIESGEQLKGGYYKLDEPNRMSCVCFNRDEEIIINDYDKEHAKWIDQDLAPKMGESVSSLIYIPLRSKDKRIGVVTVQSFKKNVYSDNEVNLLRSIGVYSSIALENARLYENMEDMVRKRTEEVVQQKEEVEKSYQNTKLIAQINKDISKSITIESLISNVYNSVNTLMDATCFGIGIYNEETQEITMPGFIENGETMEDFSYSINDQRLASWSFKNQKEVFVNDYYKEYEDYIKGMQAPVSGKDSASIIYIPLFSKDKIVGVLTVQSFEKNVYNEYHLDILRGLAASIASAIENAILYESLEEKVKERTAEVVAQKEQIEKTSENTRLLSEIGKDIASELSSEGIISKVYQSINDMMDASIFGIALYQPKEETLLFKGALERGEKLDDFSYSIDEKKIATICFKKQEEIIINDWSNEMTKWLKEDYAASAGEKPESMIYLPLVSKDNTIGVITVQSFNKNSYDQYHVNIIRTLSLYVASALENASLYEDMEDRVQRRTAEIEKAYEDTKLLGQISRTIVESLEVEQIISSVYENINTLLDATCFGIGIHKPEREVLYMPGFLERGVRLDDLEFDLNDTDRFASVCFNKDIEVIINDIDVEFNKYIKDMPPPPQGDGTQSIVYLPLKAKGKLMGVLTVQSFEKNAYSEYQLNLVRSLATTVATALDNAMLYESLEDKVRERTLELSQQKEIIEEKNKHITDSIRYAKRIQDATLPSIGLVRSYLPDSFVLFKPKDIVSGDFYWVEHIDDIVLFAVVDCTGHGVPGAFLSLIGHNSLNQIVNELGIYKPSEILFELDKIVHGTLQNNVESTNIKDGMDMAICSLNLQTLELEFAGAYNPLYLIRKEELQEVKGDKIAIGTGQEDLRYQNSQIQLQKEDRIYLFSDGYADQFGGPKGKKFKYSQFKELLIQIHAKPMDEQHKLLNHYIEAWQGDLEQLDDVCVIGVKV